VERRRLIFASQRKSVGWSVRSRRLVERRVNQLKGANSCWARIKQREERGDMPRPAPIPVSSASHQHTVPHPNRQRHRHSHNRHPQSLRPVASVSSHVPTQQSHEEARQESHRPLADQERGMDALELLVQEMEERVGDDGLVIFIR
jgi:hypothetical protein